MPATDDAVEQIRRAVVTGDVVNGDEDPRIDGGVLVEVGRELHV